ncbi:hypothetical protein BJX61DRAFT_514518 [Aspergillus egyptiacus]|nr:hypothetical protein BJX61DRAFT_514518 [Aspergillus egyptiacus]
MMVRRFRLTTTRLLVLAVAIITLLGLRKVGAARLMLSDSVCPDGLTLRSIFSRLGLGWRK